MSNFKSGLIRVKEPIHIVRDPILVYSVHFPKKLFFENHDTTLVYSIEFKILIIQ